MYHIKCASQHVNDSIIDTRPNAFPWCKNNKWYFVACDKNIDIDHLVFDFGNSRIARYQQKRGRAKSAVHTLHTKMMINGSLNKYHCNLLYDIFTIPFSCCAAFIRTVSISIQQWIYNRMMIYKKKKLTQQNRKNAYRFIFLTPVQSFFVFFSDCCYCCRPISIDLCACVYNHWVWKYWCWRGKFAITMMWLYIKFHCQQYCARFLFLLVLTLFTPLFWWLSEIYIRLDMSRNAKTNNVNNFQLKKNHMRRFDCMIFNNGIRSI